MTALANVRLLPGVGDGPEERPPTYVEYLESIGLKWDTIRNYRMQIRSAERGCAELGVELISANASVLALLANQMANTHATRGQFRCALKHWYEWQDRMNAPLRAVRVPPNPQMVCKALTSEEARALEATASGIWPQGAAVLFGLYLGLRRTEIAAAEWDRFDHVMQWYTVTGKFEKTATLPVNPILAEELAPHRQAKGWLFPARLGTRDGSHVHPATVWHWTKDLAKQAGIEGRFSTHVLRHTCLTTALDNTENLRAVMAFARHEKPETTAGYTRTTNEQLRRISDALRY